VKAKFPQVGGAEGVAVVTKVITTLAKFIPQLFILSF
jgi:hypothetical protein